MNLYVFVSVRPCVSMADFKMHFRINNQSGTVLVLVLWVLAMLSVIGSYYAVEARIRRNLGQGAWNELQGREAVYSILRLAALKVAPPGAKRNMEDTGVDLQNVRLYPDGTLYSVKFGDNRLEFALRDESGKLSINKASELQLEKLLAALLGDDQEDRVRIITESILDWRDADNIVREDGAEDAFYSDMVPPYQAADRPFLLLDELLLVRGVDAQLYYGPIEWYSEEDAEEGPEEEGASAQWTGGLRDVLSVYNDASGISMDYAAEPLKKVSEGSTGGAAKGGKAICMTLQKDGTTYAVYWARQTNGRFSIINWTEQGTMDNYMKDKESQN